MKKPADRILAVASAVLLLLAGLGACELGVTPSQAENGTTLVLTLKSGLSGQKTLAPEVSMNIASYDIHGFDQKGNTFDQADVKDSTLVVNSLYADTWTFAATAKNAGGDQIGAGEGSVTLVKGDLVTCNITITPLTGQGTLDISISWPAGTIVSPSIISSLTSVDGVKTDLPFTLAADCLSATAAATPEHGYYTWSLQLNDGTDPAFGMTEVVRILANSPTIGNIQLTANQMKGIGDVQLSFTPRLDSPIGITLSGQQSSIVLGGPMTLTASSSPVDSYQWYLDGNPISGATNASVTVGQNLSLGHYDLNVVVRKGTILSSTSTEFNVVRQMTFGSSGSGSGQLGSPWGIALDSSGRIYVADTYNNRVVRMDNMSGSGWTAYGSYGPNTGQFYDPLGGIAVDSSGRIYVADTYNNRIVRMDDMSGSGWTTLHPVSAPYQFTRPCGIAVDSSGRIYVADANNHRIVRMDDMNGSGWTSYGSYGSGTGQLSYPRGIAVDSNGRIYAADSGNNRITRMDDMSGSGWTTYGTAGSASGQFYSPDGVAVDSSGRIYVADSYNSRVVRFADMSGSGWTTYDNAASATGQFRIPNGIVVDAFSRIYVADTNNCRIVSFSFP